MAAHHRQRSQRDHRAPPRHRGGVPGRGRARRAAPAADGTGADVPALGPRAPVRDQGRPHRRGRRRGVRRLRPVPRGEASAGSGAASPTSTLRPRLLERLYPYMARSPVAQQALARQFFGRDREQWAEPGFGHRTRWQSTAALQRLFTPEVRREAGRVDVAAAPARLAAAGVRHVVVPGARPVPRDEDAPRRLPPLVTGRPDADGPLDRGPLPVPRRGRHRAGQLLPASFKLPRPPGEARPEARRPRAWSRTRSFIVPSSPTGPRCAVVHWPRHAGLGPGGDEQASRGRGRDLRPRSGRSPVAQVPRCGGRRTALQQRQHGPRGSPVDRAPPRTSHQGSHRGRPPPSSSGRSSTGSPMATESGRTSRGAGHAT